MDRNVRGRNYNMQKVMELYESGLKPEMFHASLASEFLL